MHMQAERGDLRPGPKTGIVRIWSEFYSWIFERSPQPPGEDLTIADVLSLLSRRRRTIIFFACLGLLFSLAWIAVVTPRYSASVTIGVSDAVTQMSGSGGGISSLLKLSSGDSNNAKFDRFLMQLNSVAVAQRLDQKYGLLKIVFASQWDAQSGTWRKPSGPLFETKEFVKHLLGLRPWSPPDAATLADFLSGSISVNHTMSSDIYTVTAEYGDRAFAGTLLREVIEQTNELIRQSDRANAEASERYLVRRLASESSVEMRQSLMEILATFERQLVFINNQIDYVAQPLDSINVSKAPVAPQRLFLLILGPLLGAVFGSLLVFLRP